MEFERSIPALIDWLPLALVIFVSAVSLVTVIGCVAGFVVAAVQRGPIEGFYAVAKTMANAATDFAHFSLRRTMAMTILAVQESIRRRVLIGFAVFVVVMLFAGWYLDVKSDQPARLYLSFVLTASNYLVIALALVLSTISLPADIKNRTIYTIVTKPVRCLEIVLGRVFGFTVVGTILLLAMCAMSYAFVVRGLSHGHEVETAARVAEPDSDSGGVIWSGATTPDHHHRHEANVYEDGSGETNFTMGHHHTVQRIGDGDPAEYEFGRPQGMLQARVPHYGILQFLDRAGSPGAGIDVGAEWSYRSYIEGGTLSAAIWSFDGIYAGRYPDGLNLELGIRVFRSHKGDIEEGIRGTITVKNPNPAAKIRESEPISFTAKEFAVDRQFIPRSLKALDSNGAVQEVDLFADLTVDGRCDVSIQCIDRGQYLGMATPDAYILDRDGQFWLNFIKGFGGIWLQMLLVNTFGVMFSTFLSGPVALLATMSTISIGMFQQFIFDLFSGDLEGGGPVEAMIRVVTQANLVTDLEIGYLPLLVVKVCDMVFLWTLWVLSHALPNYTGLSTADYVANGYNISGNLIAMHLLTTLSYVLVVSMIGYFFLKTREVAA
jgi:hypothetical protein